MRASELFAEEMVKLPVELVEYPADRCDWTAPVLAALAKRDELERLALAEWDGGRGAPWFRPVALFQAQSVSKNGETRITAERLRRFLAEEAKRPAGEIAVVTGEQKELDGVDVRDPQCPVRLVITVEALKEGWDCPSAAVLCSVANVHSETATVQLLGRVMRQPDAQRRKTPALDKAFAFVTSDGFGTAAAALAEGLRRRGFDKAEAAAAIQTEFPDSDGLFAERPDAVSLSPETFEAVAALLPSAVRVSPMADGGATLSVSAELPPDAVDAVAAVLDRAAPSAAAQWRAKSASARRRAAEEEQAPCRTQRLVLPRLAAQLAGEQGVFLFDAEDAYAELCDGFAALLPDSLPPGTFRMERAGDAFRLELHGEVVRHSGAFQDTRQTAFQSEGFGTNVDAEGVVNALDRLTADPMISRAEKRGWIARVVASLLADGTTPDALFAFRHVLADELLREMEKARAATRKNAYQSVFRLGGCEAAAPLLRWDDAKAFVLDDSFAAACNGLRLYDGNYLFQKHFLGHFRVPAFDGKLPHGEGEEFACAQLIDAHPAVATWLRNPARHPRAFRLPVSDDWFYPDFVGQLEDGRFFAVEYKGEHLASNAETLEKSAIGRLWADLSGGKCLYATVFREKKGADVRAQLDALFRE
ncbi:MAG: hypothetical protein IJS32_07845 [Kiritimatiellae bacterium]|nr:hypothetical protein [Kiritimatiellia bacterium]